MNNRGRMNCIDVIEGLAKVLLGKVADVSNEDRLDDSEYIRSVKAIIEAVALFVKNNPEVSETPELIGDVLYDFAKAQWLARLEKIVAADPDAGNERDLEYQAYCYDYLYAHGNYPR